MRKFLFAVVMTALFVGPSSLVAQEKGLTPLQGLLGVQSGEYKFFHYDGGLVQQKYLDETFARAAEDKAYFLDTVKSIELEFQSLMKSTIYLTGEGTEKDGVLTLTKRGGLLWLSQQSTATGVNITAKDFLAAVNALHLARLSLETRIATLTAIQEGALPSQSKLKDLTDEDKKLPKKLQDAKLTEDVPKYGNLDFGPIRKFYEGKLAEVIKMTDGLEFNVILLDKTKKIITGLVLPPAVLKYTAEQLEKMQEEMNELRTWNAKSYDAINDMTKYQRQFVTDFITAYGFRYRKLGEREEKKRAEDAKQLADIFWTRSYLRAAYGMPIGAIGIDYQEQWANLDFFTVSTNALSRFHEQPVWKEKSLLQIDRNFRLCFERAGVRAEKIMDGNLGFIATGENLLTYLGGKRNQAAATFMMLGIMGADVFEERLVQQAGGLAKMKARFRDRYLRSDEDRKYYSQLRKDYDPQPGERDTATGFNKESVLGYFRTVRSKMQLKEADLAVAADLEATFNMATGANRFANERKGRIDDLFGPDKP